MYSLLSFSIHFSSPKILGRYERRISDEAKMEISPTLATSIFSLEGSQIVLFQRCWWGMYSNSICEMTIKKMKIRIKFIWISCPFYLPLFRFYFSNSSKSVMIQSVNFKIYLQTYLGSFAPWVFVVHSDLLFIRTFLLFLD